MPFSDRHILSRFHALRVRPVNGAIQIAGGALLLLFLGFLSSGCQEQHDSEAEARRALDEIAALGYVSTAPILDGKPTGVILWDEEAAQPGLNLYFSSHANEAILCDMAGNILHYWRSEFDRTWPEFDGHAWIDWKLSWADGVLLPNGDLIGIQAGVGLFKLNRDSEILWARRNNAHHDLDLDDQGRIHVLTRRHEPVELPDGGRKWRMIDEITLCSPEGETLDQIRIEDAYRDSGFDSGVPPASENRDPFHSNTIVWLDGSLVEHEPAFRRDNLLLSIRNTHTLAVYDPEKRKIVWQIRGDWKRQHEPVLLEDGAILLFDNKGARKTLKGARVMEVLSSTGETRWSYDGLPDGKLRSTTEGAVSRLANGNTLITDSNRARVVEITHDKRVVWEFINPHPFPLKPSPSDPSELKRKKGNATLHELIRIDPDHVAGWLDLTDAQGH